MKIYAHIIIIGSTTSSSKFFSGQLKHIFSFCQALSTKLLAHIKNSLEAMCKSATILTVTRSQAELLIKK